MKKYKYSKSFSWNGKRFYIRGDTLKEVYTKMEQKKMQLEEDPRELKPDMTLASWAIQCRVQRRVQHFERKTLCD